MAEQRSFREYTARHLSPSFWNSLSVTLQLVILNVVFFFVLLIWISFDQNLLQFIALQPQAILAGRYWWTFLTSMFMHAGFLHLFVNMFSLLSIGALVERLLGRKRYLWFYLFSGLFAGLFFVLVSFVFQHDLSAYAVGASGALFALIGFLMMVTPNLPVFILLIPVPIKMKYAAPAMLLLLWIISLSPVLFGGQQIPIGNTAHLGGLLAGVFYGLYMQRKYKNKAGLIKKYFS